MTKLVKCDFGINSDAESCVNATMDPMVGGYFRVFTPFISIDKTSGEEDAVVLDFCCIAHLAGWAISVEEKTH